MTRPHSLPRASSRSARRTSLPSADAVLAELKAGNARYVAKTYQRPHQTAARQHALASGQSPHCAILTCADSRVPPEIIFDKGLGDIFDVRVAGNVAGDDEMASLEYAAEHLHVPLVVVMGHSHCGAVSAALEGGTLPGKLPELMAALRPAVDQSAHEPGDRIDERRPRQRRARRGTAPRREAGALGAGRGREAAHRRRGLLARDGQGGVATAALTCSAASGSDPLGAPSRLGEMATPFLAAYCTVTVPTIPGWKLQ